MFAIRKETIVVISIFVIMLLVSAKFSKAASYNFFFNNVEQGANSTASPTLTVDGKKVKEKSAQQIKQEDGEIPTESTPESATEKNGTTSSDGAVIPQESASIKRLPQKTEPKFRALVSGAWFSQAPSLSSNLKRQDSQGASLTVTLTPLKYLGFSFLVGQTYGIDKGFQHLGAEVELTPLHVGLFGFDNLLEAGVMAGAMASNENKSGKVGRLSLGARAALNFGGDWVLNASYRANVIAHNRYAELGLGYRF